MRAIVSKIVPVVLTLGLLGGCGDEAADVGEVDDLGGKADGVVHPAGQYTNASPKIGEIVSLTLNDDNTFDRQVMVVSAIGSSNNMTEDSGTYKFTKSTTSTKKYIRFVDDSGNLIDRFIYKLSGKTLQLEDASGGSLAHFFSLTQAASGQQEGQPCGGFTGNALACAAGLVCQSTSNIPDVGGTCVKDDSNPCEAAGGSCTALVPGGCANGTIGDARTYSCGGGLGVMCCLPPVATCRIIAECVTGKHWDANACACVDDAACSADSDCKGILPQFCKVCSDGSSACAHHACNNGQCVIETCAE